MLDGPEDLLRKIRLGEDTAIELKTVTFQGSRVREPSHDDLADEIAAMANTATGIIVFGVDDRTRQIVGVPLERLDVLERLIFEICGDSIRPPVQYRSFRMELPDESGTARPVLKVEVPRSLFTHESPGGYFHRQGSSKRRLAPDALARLFQQRSQARVIRFDEQAVPETNARSLEPELYERFLGTGRDRPVETLRKLCLVTGDEEGNERATVAGVLMATRSPERWLAGAAIQAVRYRGDRPDSNYQLDAQLITGALDEQIRLALAFARRNSGVAARKRPGRVDRPQYSDRALFEAIVNAVAHRDYSIHGSKIRLFLFDDRLELYSPGPFPNTVTVENVALRQSTRNELLTTLLSRCRVGDRDAESGRQYFMEKRGEGVPVILEESRKLSGQMPTYRVVDDAEVQLTIYPARESKPT